MILHIRLIFLSLILTAVTALSHPNNFKNALRKEIRASLPNLESITNSNILSKRQNDPSNPYNCTARCSITSSRYRAGRDICIDLTHGQTTDGRRGAFLTVQDTTLDAGGNININVRDENNNGLVIVYMENVVMTAGGRVNLNFGEVDCPEDQNCDVLIYMRNVTSISEETGTTRIFDDQIYMSRRNGGKL
ncbi:hypothetical protein BJX96DRAFT_171167 [Aspergillus floccosus]